MNGYNFTARVRRALQAAREAAHALGNDHVGPEHMVLGLIRDRAGSAVSALIACGVDLATLESVIEDAMRAQRTTSRESGPDLSYTSDSKRVLERAMEAARDLASAHVGTEHLLLGLLADEHSDARRLLLTAGVTDEVVRTHISRLSANEDQAPASHSPPADRRVQPTITVLLDYGGERVIAKKFSTSEAARRFFEEMST
jgi:ATP-dependent Clp protease ATP-binding subunit ClpC